DGSHPVQLFIREDADGGGGLPTVPAQQFESTGLGDACVLLSMFGIDVGDKLPSNLWRSLAAGDGSRQIDLDWVHAGNMVHDHADRAPVLGRHGRTPLGVREPFRKRGQTGGAFFDAIRQYLGATSSGTSDLVISRALWLGHQCLFLKRTHAMTLLSLRIGCGQRARKT